MYTIREYRQGDIYKLLLSHDEHYQMQYAREDVLLASTAFTCEDDDGSLIGCAGLASMWIGVFEAWIALDQDKKNKHPFVFRKLKAILSDLPKHVVRVQAHVNVETERQKEFMEFLGFEIEACLQNYFPGKKDCIVWRRLY